MKKVILKLDFPDDNAKEEAMRAVYNFPGINSITMDVMNNKWTVIGDVDPVEVVNKLRMHCSAVMVSLEELAYNAYNLSINTTYYINAHHYVHSGQVFVVGNI